MFGVPVSCKGSGSARRIDAAGHMDGEVGQGLVSEEPSRGLADCGGPEVGWSSGGNVALGWSQGGFLPLIRFLWGPALGPKGRTLKHCPQGFHETKRWAHHAHLQCFYRVLTPPKGVLVFPERHGPTSVRIETDAFGVKN